MRHFGFDRSWGTSVLALSFGLALPWAHEAGAQSAGANVRPIPVVQAETAPHATSDFVEAVRQALVQNPEIILEVLSVLEAEQAAAASGKDLALIADHAHELFEGLDLTKPILIEFQDYNCGYCRRVHPEVTLARAEIPDLQVVVLEFPILGEDSQYTAEIALSLKSLYGEEMYLRFVDTVMSLETPANPATVLRILDLLDVDGQIVTRDMKTPHVKSELERAAYLARTMGVRGTPAFIGPSGISRGASSRAELIAMAQPARIVPSSDGE